MTHSRTIQNKVSSVPPARKGLIAVGNQSRKGTGKREGKLGRESQRGDLKPPHPRPLSSSAGGTTCVGEGMEV